jgi:hypothetical protein
MTKLYSTFVRLRRYPGSLVEVLARNSGMNERRNSSGRRQFTLSPGAARIEDHIDATALLPRGVRLRGKLGIQLDNSSVRYMNASLTAVRKTGGFSESDLIGCWAK